MNGFRRSINRPDVLEFVLDFLASFGATASSTTSSSSSGMSLSFFLAVEALAEVDLDDDFVVFDLAEALELGGSFCAVDCLMALVLCSTVEGPASCGQKGGNPERNSLPAKGSSSCVDFRPGFLGLLRRAELELSSRVTRSSYVLFVKLSVAGLPTDLREGEAETLRLGFFRGEALPSKMSARRFLLLGTNILSAEGIKWLNFKFEHRIGSVLLTLHGHGSAPVNVVVSGPCSPQR